MDRAVSEGVRQPAEHASVSGTDVSVVIHRSVQSAHCRFTKSWPNTILPLNLAKHNLTGERLLGFIYTNTLIHTIRMLYVDRSTSRTRP